MQCPDCGHEQSSTVECEKCGIVFAKWKTRDGIPPQRHDLPSPLEEMFRDSNVLSLLENPHGLLPALTGWEVARKWDIVDTFGRLRGSAAEDGGMAARFGKSGAPVRIAVFSQPSQQLALMLVRPNSAFGPMIVVSGHGEQLGSMRRKLSIMRPRYVLRDASRRAFATIVGSLTRGSVPIFDDAGEQRGEIRKELVEAQRFKIDFMNHRWPLAQRAVILAAAVTIDCDAFENRSD